MEAAMTQPIPRTTDPATDSFLRAMRQVTASVAVVTTRHGTVRAGLTATAICSATTEPPTLLVCVNRGAGAAAAFGESGLIGVSFLAADQHGIARAFSTSGLSQEERFAEGAWSCSETGAPLLDDAVAAFDCVIAETVACGGHNIFVSRVVAARHAAHGPLLYRDGFFRRLDQTF